MPRIADSFLAEMDQEAQTTRRVLERVPGDKLSWKPHTKSMSLGQLALHVATIPGGVAQILSNDSFEVPSFDQPAAQSATELIPALDESVRTAKQVLGGMEDSKLMGTWKLTKNGKELMAAPRGAMVVCWACSAVWRCKSSGQPDGGEGLVMMQGLPPRGGV